MQSLLDRLLSNALRLGAHFRNKPSAFVSGDKRQRWLHRPIAICGVQVGVADSARDYFDQYFAWLWIWYWNLTNL